MDAALDLSRWREKPRGVAYRRWTIVSTGLRQLLRLRFFKILLTASWLSGVFLALIGFVFSQAVTSGGWLDSFANSIGPRAEAMASALGAFLLLYPDICIGGAFTLLFWLHSFVGLWLSLLALTAVVPRLVTRDRASHALIVYLSRPLTSADYLVGKLGIIVGVLLCVWTGPLLLGWLLSVAFAPNTDFVRYSLEPLGRALLFNAIGLATLGAIALGVSAASRTSRNTIVLWVGLWVIFGVMATPPDAPLFLKRASFTQNLNEVRALVLEPGQALTEAGETLPLTNRTFADSLTRAGTRTRPMDTTGGLASLAVFVVCSSFVFLRRLRPE